jgi:hypothetical protein
MLIKGRKENDMTQFKAKDVAAGAGGGLLGTALIRGMLEGTKRWMPETLPPMKDEPGRFMVAQAKRLLPSGLQARLSRDAEKRFALALALGYGVTFATAYAATRPAEKVLRDGTALGLATWAAGYLGWLPATGLMPPVWKQEPKTVVPNVLSHLFFGIATVAACKWLRKRL